MIDVPDDLPREHDVLLVEHENHYTLRRALGIGVNSTHHDGVPVVVFADKAEGLDAAAQLAATNGVDLWLVEDGHASLLTRHRPTEET